MWIFENNRLIITCSQGKRWVSCSILSALTFSIIYIQDLSNTNHLSIIFFICHIIIYVYIILYIRIFVAIIFTFIIPFFTSAVLWWVLADKFSLSSFCLVLFLLRISILFFFFYFSIFIFYFYFFLFLKVFFFFLKLFTIQKSII